MFRFYRSMDMHDHQLGCDAIDALNLADARLHEAVQYLRQGPASAVEIASRAPRIRQVMLLIFKALQIVEPFEKPQPQDVTPEEWKKLVDWAAKAQGQK
jgi:hypothetical protein